MSVFLTHGYFIHEDEKEQKIMRPYPPLGLLYVSAWLEKHDIDHEVFDTTFSSMEQLQNKLQQQLPTIIAIYVNLMTKPNVIRLIAWVRSQSELSDATIMLGGPEVANNKEGFLNNGADFLVLGEGEQTALELIDCINRAADVSQVAGIAYRDKNGTIQQTAERTKMRDLDELPLPNRSSINMQQYFDAWKQKHGESTISINTMRGCPYTCRWCSRAVYGLSYRRRSPAHVVQEMLWIRNEYKVDTIWFVDDVFTISHKWLREFCDELKRHDLSFPYECITRADRMNEEVIGMLKESGCTRVWIGAESGSQRIIDKMDRRVDVEKVQEMIQAVQKHGIEAGTFIMVGYPGETMDDLKATVEHLKRAAPSHFTITITYPIRGTELFEEVMPYMTSTPAWENSTDRDIDFERTYPRQFYNYAVRWMVNEVNAHKAASQGDSLPYVKHKLKSMVMKTMMKSQLLF